MQKRYLTSTVLAVAVFLMSCNLSDFSTDKLTPLNQVSPVLYLPIAYGTFKFSDYAKIAETGNAVVNTAQIDFKPNPIPYDIQELNFSSTKLDSLYIIVKSQNETPMKYRYQFSFSGETFDSGLLKSALLTPSNDVLE
ncbi:MAG: hypothetical protein LWW85_08415, partial [Marinilabiliales bacterium]|nr:hypothetical protein [Marinilabiliales bacterium]